ncbi:MAG: hypothetical protein FWD73_17380 [Polyangiaceae bacterium]|nr:hypothetical protein [Polyangiaceae bacterium]
MSRWKRLLFRKEVAPVGEKQPPVTPKHTNGDAQTCARDTETPTGDEKTGARDTETASRDSKTGARDIENGLR